MADLDGKQSNFITRVVNTDGALIEALKTLQALRDEYDAMGYISTIDAGDFTGDNAHGSPAALTAVFTSLEAINATLEAGHWTNLYALKK